VYKLQSSVDDGVHTTSVVVQSRYTVTAVCHILAMEINVKSSTVWYSTV